MIILLPLVRFESICRCYMRNVPPPNNYGFHRTMNVKNCKEGAVTVRLRPRTEGALGASRGQARFKRERYSPPRTACSGKRHRSERLQNRAAAWDSARKSAI